VSVTRAARVLAYNRRRAAETTGARRAAYLRAAAEALAGLHAADQCEDCGAPLRDPVSVARHVGPDCQAKRDAVA
jgi:hypothetical protein